MGKHKTRNAFLISLLLSSAGLCPAQSSKDGAFHPQIPRVWDDKEMERLELPLASRVVIHPMPSRYYYQIPVRQIYKTYPIYHPDFEPAGYFNSLLEKAPEVAFDRRSLGRMAFRSTHVTANLHR